MHRSFLALATALLTACATPPALLKETASGWPEETLSGVTVEAVRSAIMEGCVARGALVQDSGPYHVLCGKVLQGGDAVLAQVLVGNSYSTTPELKIRFTLYQASGIVRVTAQQWVETQMAFGQMRRAEMNGNAQRNSVQAFLGSLPGAGSSKVAAATVAPVQPQAARSVEPASVPPAPGKDSFVAERFAKEMGCTRDKSATLIGKGPGYESYSFACMNGETLIVRCQWGNCRALK